MTEWPNAVEIVYNGVLKQDSGGFVTTLARTLNVNALYKVCSKTKILKQRSYLHYSSDLILDS